MQKISVLAEFDRVSKCQCNSISAFINKSIKDGYTETVYIYKSKFVTEIGVTKGASTILAYDNDKLINFLKSAEK